MYVNETTTSIKNKIFKLAVKLAAIGLVTFLILEAMLRILDPLGIKYFFENDRYFSILEANEIYSYIHPGNFKGTFQGAEIKTNSRGFRGPEFNSTKKNDTTRVLIVGDSVVLGWGVSQDAIFPTLLQNRFDSEKRKVEIIPMGVSSWNTRNQYEYLNFKGFGLDPDIITMVIVSNDVVPKKSGVTSVPRKKLFPEKISSGDSNPKKTIKDRLWSGWNYLGGYLFAVRYVQYFIKASWQGNYFATLDSSSPAWLDASLALDGIIEYCRKNSIELVFHIYGSAESINSNSSLKMYKYYLENKGFEIGTFPQSLIGDPKFRISIADGHANEEGHKIIADVLFDAISLFIPSKNTATP